MLFLKEEEGSGTHAGTGTKERKRTLSSFGVVGTFGI
jgi:hypothetical protein